MKAFLARHVTKILNITAVSAAHTGTSKQVRPSRGDETKDVDQEFKFHVRSLATGGASSPTVQVYIEGSYDNLNWFTLLTGTAFSADNAHHVETLDDEDKVLPTYVRARTALGGGTPPTAHTVSVEIISNGDFTIV